MKSKIRQIFCVCGFFVCRCYSGFFIFMEREKKELTNAAPQRAFDPLLNGHTAPEAKIIIPQNYPTKMDSEEEESQEWRVESIGPTVLVYSSSAATNNA